MVKEWIPSVVWLRSNRPKRRRSQSMFFFQREECLAVGNLLCRYPLCHVRDNGLAKYFAQTQAKWWHNRKWNSFCLAFCLAVWYAGIVWNTASESLFKLFSLSETNGSWIMYPLEAFHVFYIILHSYFYFTWLLLSLFLMVHDLFTFTCFFGKK